METIRILAQLNKFEVSDFPVVLSGARIELRINDLALEREAIGFLGDSYQQRAFGILGEIEADAITDPLSHEVFDLVERLVHLFRLIDPGGVVSAPWLYIQGESGGTSMILSPCEEGPGYLTLNSDDVTRLRELWSEIHKPEIPKPLLESLRWYGYARERVLVRQEERIVNLATSSEALFLDNERGGKGDKVSRRAEAFIGAESVSIEKLAQHAYFGLGGPVSINVAEHMKNAYDLRNAVVHADKTEYNRILANYTSILFSSLTELIIRQSLLKAIRECKLPDRR